MHQVQVQLALHGAIMLFVSLLAGGFFARAINNEDREVAWRVVHSGGSMGGVMLIAYASIVPITSLTSWALGAFARLAIVGGWALVAGMFGAAFTGKRGLKFGVSGVGSLVYISYIAGGILSLAANGFLIVGLAGSLA